MYYLIFRLFPKSAFSRLMGRVAEVRWPRWLQVFSLRVYIRIFTIDMSQFQGQVRDFPTFNAFFTRAVRPEARPLPDAESQPDALVCPVDGAVVECTPIRTGRVFQAKGRDYSLQELLHGHPGWEAYDGGTSLTLYLSPKDYHRIHAPCSGTVRRFGYMPGELWTVSPAGVRGVPRLFCRNERLVSYLETAFGEVALVAVGATVVGGIKVVYHSQTSNRPSAKAQYSESVSHFLFRGAELGRFEIGSTVVLLFRPGEAQLEALQPGQAVRMGQIIGTAAGAGAGATASEAP